VDTAILNRLSRLISTINGVSKDIASVIGRPAQIGHLGEFIASHVFDIELERSASNKGFDGRFRSGTLAGNSVNVKWYAKSEAAIDVSIDCRPDYYLVLTGPTGWSQSSRGMDRPWLIEDVYLFEATSLVAALVQRGCKIGVATSVARAYWDSARIYPASSELLALTQEQSDALALFGTVRHEAVSLNAAELGPNLKQVQELARFWDTHDMTDFDDQLVEVNEPVFDRERAITLRLPTEEAETVHKMAASKGVGDAELIREWVREKIGTK
jgi:hypothetical protein